MGLSSLRAPTTVLETRTTTAVQVQAKITVSTWQISKWTRTRYSSLWATIMISMCSKSLCSSKKIHLWTQKSGETWNSCRSGTSLIQQAIRSMIGSPLNSKISKSRCLSPPKGIIMTTATKIAPATIIDRSLITTTKGCSTMAIMLTIARSRMMRTPGTLNCHQ